jgi:hypothetical protein
MVFMSGWAVDGKSDYHWPTVAGPLRALIVMGFVMVMVSGFEPEVLNQMFPLAETAVTP